MEKQLKSRIIAAAKDAAAAANRGDITMARQHAKTFRDLCPLTGGSWAVPAGRKTSDEWIAINKWSTTTTA